MTIKYLKKATKTASTDDTKTKEIVQNLLKELEKSKEEGCKELTKKFDKYDGEIIVSKEKIEEIKKKLDQKTKDDIRFSYDRVKKFAEAQLKNYGQDFEVELSNGLYAGQKLVPVNTAGCYIPGGRYAHIASAVMSVTTAKVAGVKNIIACSPPKENIGAHPSIIYTADLCGADVILNLGGVPAIAAMTYGLFGNAPADILVGPGNQFVAEAKRILFGKVGIDLFAGPTEIGIIADETADPEIVAVDLVGQAEHGYNSPAWLYTTSQKLADTVMKRVPELIDELPEVPRLSAEAAWRDYGEVILCDTNEEMVKVSDDYAPEHLELQTKNLKWFAMPAVAGMALDLGGIQYTAAPSNGFYMGTEIGSLNLSDKRRYNILPMVAKMMELDVSEERTLWRDKALVEVNIAVLYSFKKQGVRMLDHHALSEFFMRFNEEEEKMVVDQPTEHRQESIVHTVSDTVMESCAPLMQLMVTLVVRIWPLEYWSPPVMSLCCRGQWMMWRVHREESGGKKRGEKRKTNASSVFRFPTCLFQEMRKIDTRCPQIATLCGLNDHKASLTSRLVLCCCCSTQTLQTPQRLLLPFPATCSFWIAPPRLSHALVLWRNFVFQRTISAT